MKVGFRYSVGMALLMGLSTMVSCQNGKSKQENVAVDSVSEFVDSDSVHVTLNDSLAQVDVRLIYPTAEDVCSDSVVHWMGELMRGLWLSTDDQKPLSAYAGSNRTLKAQADYYSHAAHEQMRKDAIEELKAMQASGFDDTHPAYVSTMETKLISQTSKYATYQSVQYSYAGGAHGSMSEAYATFSKSDGHRLTATLKPSATPQIQHLLRQGLLRYFEAQLDKEEADNISEETIDQYLFADEVKTGIPVPRQVPVMTTEGLLFIYQQYEIAPYAAGILTFTVPYADIEPYMTDEAKALR